MGPRRGFTLVELLVVVAMIGVLAAIAIMGYRKFTASAGTAEALAVMQGIRNAEETYKAESLVYMGCSGCGSAPCTGGATKLDGWYPQTAAPSSARWAFNNPGHADYGCWQQLNVVTDGPVRFGYAVVAGIGDPVAAAGIKIKTPPAFPSTTEPWYLVQAAGDRDDNGVFSYLFATSFQSQIFVEDDTE